MKIKPYKIKKQDVEKLSQDNLMSLAEWGRSDIYKLLKKVGEEGITRRAVEAMHNVYSDFAGAVEHGRLSGIKLGIDFILDAPQRAREELKGRKKQ